MRVSTRMFGDIEISEDKIISFNMGIIGFEFLKNFTLIHDQEEENPTILWLQSLDEAEFALPVLNPLIVQEGYNPSVEEELFNNIGEMKEDAIVLVTITVPSEIEKMSVNLKAPIIINPETLRGCQLIVEDSDYPVKYPVYELLKNKQGKAGE